ncbi:MAG: hypothetical protein ACREQW_23395 [Candidatus Binatia bacterium]
MKDTSAEIDKKFRSMLLARAGEERLKKRILRALRKAAENGGRRKRKGRGR